MKSFLKYFLVFHLNDKFPVQVKQVFEVIEKQSKATSFYDFSSSVLKEIFTSPLFELILSAEITTPQVVYLCSCPRLCFLKVTTLMTSRKAAVQHLKTICVRPGVVSTIDCPPSIFPEDNALCVVVSVFVN